MGGGRYNLLSELEQREGGAAFGLVVGNDEGRLTPPHRIQTKPRERNSVRDVLVYQFGKWLVTRFGFLIGEALVQVPARH